jgi:hypothetical protein
LKKSAFSKAIKATHNIHVKAIEFLSKMNREEKNDDDYNQKK